MTTSRRSASRPTLPPAVHNRHAWDRQSDAYDRRFEPILGGPYARAWGLWRIPESRARWLGPVRGRRILEVGCGAGRWAIALRRAGARVVGIDQSGAQLAKANRLARGARVRVPLVRANAERLPFRDGHFDLAFCDWGALSFSDPERSIPECARVLRRGGRLVFVTGTLLSLLTLDRRADHFSRRLRTPYFGPLRREVGNMFEYRPSAGEWIEIFAESGLVVEHLSETRPRPGDRSRYLAERDERWAHRFPAEMVWQVRKP
jgi:ubiquinone/menaquinone biosynthesis C-methylase UbiE